MNMVFRTGLLAILAVCMLGCGSNLVQHVELQAIHEGKPRGVVVIDLNEKDVDGQKGWHVRTEVKMSIGDKSRVHTEKDVVMEPNYHMVSVKSVSHKEDGKVVTEMTLKNGVVTIETNAKGKKSSEEVPVKNDLIYGEIHHLIYSKDLTKPGTRKAYNIFHPDIRQVIPVVVKCVGKEKLNEGNKTRDVMHYGVQSVYKAGKYDGYYVDLETNELVRVSMGDVTLQKPGLY